MSSFTLRRCWISSVSIIAIALSACVSSVRNDAQPEHTEFHASTKAATLGFADDRLFGRRAIAANELGPMPRWQSVMVRFSGQKRSADCGESACPAQVWRKLIDEIRVLPLRDRAERVNKFFNRAPYVPAEFNWHDLSHWETPYELLARGGQCEDYAIAKYRALRESGVPDDLLRFVVVHDNLSNLDHALLVVNVDNIQLALDNQFARITPAWELQKRYDPYYALNDHGWSAYVPAAELEVASVPPPSFQPAFRVAPY